MNACGLLSANVPTWWSTHVLSIEKHGITAIRRLSPVVRCPVVVVRLSRLPFLTVSPVRSYYTCKWAWKVKLFSKSCGRLYIWICLGARGIVNAQFVLIRFRFCFVLDAVGTILCTCWICLAPAVEIYMCLCILLVYVKIVLFVIVRSLYMYRIRISLSWCTHFVCFRRPQT